MKLTQPKGELIRFDVDLLKADDKNNIPFVIEPFISGATTDDDHTPLLVCKYRIFALNKANEEIFGYLREHISEIKEFGTKVVDIPILSKFCSDTFINVEMDFQQKIRMPYNIFGRIRPPFDTMAEAVYQQLKSSGYY